MDQLSYAEIVSSLALFTAVGALTWNIFRDILSEKATINFIVAFGEAGNIKRSSVGLFADAGSLKPQHYFDNPATLIQIVNTGRKSVCVSGVGGKLKNNEWISMAVDGLPKMLQPYEVFGTTTTLKQNFLDMVVNGELKDLWVTDTKGKNGLYHEMDGND